MPEKADTGKNAEQANAAPLPSGNIALDKDVRTHLYQVADYLDQEARRALGIYLPGVCVYLQDPLVAQVNPHIGIHPIEVTCEPGLRSGPASARLVVVDYNADTSELHPGAVLKEGKNQAPRYVSAQGAPLGPEAHDLPEFRQVNAWAVAQSVLDLFEGPDALGRPLPWAVPGNRLIIVPHAGYRQNAYYDRQSKSLQFYYYGSPTAPKYTCLSHDIVAHETGHAILDGLRPYYLRFTSVHTAAFHEFVADLAAILSALRNNQVRLSASAATGGDLTRDNVIQGLAEEFGQHISGLRPLREANNRATMDTIQGNPSPHDCSLVLTGAMFEILVAIARNHLMEKQSEDRHPLQALWWATQRFIHMALQPLDFLPPVDVDFVDYARAVLRYLILYEPYDSPRREVYIDLVRRVFHKRKLCPQEAGRCQAGGCALEGPSLPKSWDVFHSIDALSSSPTAAYAFLHDNRRTLCIPANQDIQVAGLYRTHKYGRGGRRLAGEIVLQYVWSEELPLDAAAFGPLQGQTAGLLCGGTLVFDENGNLLSWMHKPGAELKPGPSAGQGLQRLYEDGQRRREALRQHMASQVQSGQIGPPSACPNSPWSPPIQAQVQDGLLHLEIAPGMRNSLHSSLDAAQGEATQPGFGILDWGGRHAA